MPTAVRNIQIPVTLEGREVVVSVVRHKPTYTHVLVPSNTPGHEPYDVVVDADGTARCTCKGFLFNRGQCFHQRAAQVAVSA